MVFGVVSAYDQLINYGLPLCMVNQGWPYCFTIVNLAQIYQNMPAFGGMVKLTIMIEP